MGFGWLIRPTKVNGIKTFIRRTIVVVNALRNDHNDRLVFITNQFLCFLLMEALERTDRADSPHTHTNNITNGSSL